MDDDALYRLVTRDDLDGIACGALFLELGMIDSVTFASPVEVDKGYVPVGSGDIVANLPFRDEAAMCFDHHISEAHRHAEKKESYIIDPSAPSCARVVYDYYGGGSRFSHEQYHEVLEAVDKCDSAQFTKDEVLNPSRWTLFNFIVDPKTRTEVQRTYETPKEQFLVNMIDLVSSVSIDDILDDADVQDRLEVYWEGQETYLSMLKEAARVVGRTLVVDMRRTSERPAGNRFLMYAAYPETDISVFLEEGSVPDTVLISVGKSIFNDTSVVDVGSLMAHHGGGGHRNVGTCQVPAADSDDVLGNIIGTLTLES